MTHQRYLKQTTSWAHQGGIIENAIKQKAVAGTALHILEAGCGQRWTINLEGTDYVLTGVDMDNAALDLRQHVQRDLHHAVVGDLRSVDLPAHHYDVIYNAYVLEHVSGAEQVLNNFVRWLKPGGILILLVPDPDSVHGFVTRLTPHWFHVLYHRLIGHRNAGKPGFAPYPVFYDAIVSRQGLHDFCRRNKLAISAEYGDEHYRPGRGAVRWMIHAAKRLISAVSFGRFSARHTNLLYVLEKQ
jgi:SAM-dependent methyltransferase